MVWLGSKFNSNTFAEICWRFSTRFSTILPYILGKFIVGQCPLYLILTSSLKMCIRCTVLCTIFKQGSLTRIHMPVFEAFLWSDIWTRHRCPGAREYGHHWPQSSQLVLKIETENLNSFWIKVSIPSIVKIRFEI